MTITIFQCSKLIDDSTESCWANFWTRNRFFHEHTNIKIDFVFSSIQFNNLIPTISHFSTIEKMSTSCLSFISITCHGETIYSMVTTTHHIDSHEINTSWGTIWLEKEMNSIINPFWTHVCARDHHSTSDKICWTVPNHHLRIEPVRSRNKLSFWDEKLDF